MPRPLVVACSLLTRTFHRVMCLLAFVASRVESNSKTLGNCLNVGPFAGGLPAFPRPIAHPSQHAKHAHVALALGSAAVRQHPRRLGAVGLWLKSIGLTSTS
ncbi:hypothetical protein BC831DRAFT_446575, partial [Entophlyctis helioformis]